jgi:hypothetical protein
MFSYYCIARSGIAFDILEVVHGQALHLIF